MKASRLIAAIVGVVSCSGFVQIRAQQNPVIPFEFGGSAMVGDQVVRFEQDLLVALRHARGLAWSGDTRQPRTGPLNRDALMIWLVKSSLEDGNRVRYLVEFRTGGERGADGVLLGTSTDGCLQDQLSPCIEKVIADALETGKKLPKYGSSSLGFVQAAVPLRDDLVAATRERIQALDDRLIEIQDDWQKQLDAANCRTFCPPEIVDRLGKEMPIAMDVVMAQIHAEVEGFVLRTADTQQADLNKGSVAQGLEQILPKSGLTRAVFVLKSGNRRSLIVVYALLRGRTIGSSVAIRAYNETAIENSPSGLPRTGLRLADVAGEDMNGYAGLELTELHPPVAGKLFLLLSGEAMGANGPNTRMRIYRYDGEKFRPIWMPENIWGDFHVSVTVDGFNVEGEYYRLDKKRRDGYVLYENGSGVQLLDPQSIR
jgi:hypothetical protein